MSKTINEAFAEVFARIRSKRIFTSLPVFEASEEISDNAEIKAAMSKCIDFNVIVNRERTKDDEAFLFISGLRGIAEDLITLKYILRFPPKTRMEYFKVFQQLNLTQGILAQKKFFESNNPFQSVVGSGISMEEANNEAANAKAEFQAFWKMQGHAKKNGPNVKEMSEAVGLNNTYDYIYFAASNFVHFNPHALLRTGWGPEGGPFTFSVGNFGGYYRDLAAFYGAILYIGFAAAFGPLLGMDSDLKTDISDIESILLRTPRWPELVTFEELNISAPRRESRPLIDALLAAGRSGGSGFLFVKILNEIKGVEVKNIDGYGFSE